jgi:hypothetical protein
MRIERQGGSVKQRILIGKFTKERHMTHHRFHMRLDPATPSMSQTSIFLGRRPHVFHDDLLDEIVKDPFFLIRPGLAVAQ